MATHRVLYVRWLSLFDEETALLSHSPYNSPLKDFFFFYWWKNQWVLLH
jgi:hypothetical protein